MCSSSARATETRRRDQLEATRRLGRGTVAWAALLSLAAVLEVHGIRHPGTGGTLSELTRATFRTSSPAGRAVFTVGWAGFAGWFLVHITRNTESGRSLSSS